MCVRVCIGKSIRRASAWTAGFCSRPLICDLSDSIRLSAASCGEEEDGGGTDDVSQTQNFRNKTIQINNNTELHAMLRYLNSTSKFKNLRFSLVACSFSVNLTFLIVSTCSSLS